MCVQAEKIFCGCMTRIMSKAKLLCTVVDQPTATTCRPRWSHGMRYLPSGLSIFSTATQQTVQLIHSVRIVAGTTDNAVKNPRDQTRGFVSACCRCITGLMSLGQILLVCKRTSQSCAHAMTKLLYVWYEHVPIARPSCYQILWTLRPQLCPNSKSHRWQQRSQHGRNCVSGLRKHRDGSAWGSRDT